MSELKCMTESLASVLAACLLSHQVVASSASVLTACLANTQVDLDVACEQHA